MRAAWTASDLAVLDGCGELEIAAPRTDGSPGRWTPIWVVVSDGQVFVRTWQRRTTGWYGRAVAARRAGIRVDGREVDVSVTVVGDDGAEVVDAAYRTKYGVAAAGSMVSADPRLSTLRLDRR